MCVQNLKFIALSVPEITGGTQRNWAVPGYTHAQFFSKMFNGPLFGWTLWMFWPNLKFVALPTHSWDNNDKRLEFLGGGSEPQSWGRGGRRGSGIVPFERALVGSYRPSIVTFPLCLRVSEILPLLCSSTPLFPNPPLVSPKFPHVPLGVGGWRLGSEERRCWAICPCS